MNAWLLKHKKNEQDNIMDYQRYDFVTVNWSKTGSLVDKTIFDITIALNSISTNKSSATYDQAINTLYSFVNDIQIGDIVMLPIADKVIFSEITSEYYYVSPSSEYNDLHSHRRKVKWLTTPVPRDSLPSFIRLALRPTAMLTDLQPYKEGIFQFLGIQNTTTMNTHKNDESITCEYPVRSDVFAKICVPNNMTKAEANRLSVFIKTLYFRE